MFILIWSNRPNQDGVSGLVKRFYLTMIEMFLRNLAVDILSGSLSSSPHFLHETLA